MHTVAQLHAALAAQIEAGHGDKPVVVATSVSYHRLVADTEATGLVLLVGIEEQACTYASVYGEDEEDHEEDESF
jgi:hypothetical protein